MNQFISLIQQHKISNQNELKKAFWQLARVCHPDTGKIVNGEELFKKLIKDYNEAKLKLKYNSIPVQTESQNSTLPHYSVLFCELVSGNFPVNKTVRESNKGYQKKLASFIQSFGKEGAGFDTLFLQCEEELYKIRGRNIVMNPLFGAVKLILYNICSYYYLKSQFTKKAIHKWFEEIKPQLIEKKYTSTIKVFSFLIEDMDTFSIND